MTEELIKLSADTINGVCEEDFAEDECLHTFEDFYNSLDALEDGELIFCKVTKEQYDKIALHYGIH